MTTAHSKPVKPARRKTKKQQAGKSKTAKRRAITPEDLLQFQYVGDPRISPDGASIIFVSKIIGEKNQYKRNLWIVPTDGNSEPRLFTNGDKDTSPRWSPDGSRIAFVSEREEHNPQIQILDTSGGEAIPLTTFPEGSISGFKWSPDGRTIAVSFREQDQQRTQEAKKKRDEDGLSEPPRVIDHWWYRLDGDGYFNAARHHLFLVDVSTGETKSLYTKDTLGFFSFDFSPDSEELIIATNRDKRAGLKAWNDELLRCTVKSGRLKPIPNLPKGPKANVAWSPDGKSIAYAGREHEDSIYSPENLELWVCDPSTGKAKSLTAHTDYCLMAPALTDTSEASFDPVFCWAPDSGRLYCQIGWHGESHIASVTRNGKDFNFLTTGKKLHNLGTISDDGKQIALTVGSAIKLDEVYVGSVTKESISTTALTNFNGKLLKQFDLAKPKSQWVTAEDGTKVQVWVMIPPNASKQKTKKKHPAVLEIHGGPHAQYGVGFFHEFHVLNAAGYIVVYSNPRGSKGYGRDHCAAIRGEWGGKDWEDIHAVIEFMKDHPGVDSKKMGAMGGSYGGYMTNWAIGHTNDFAGAITDRCVSNLVSMAGTSDFLDEPDRYWPGNFWDKPEARWSQSPIRHFGKVKTPTLVIHSEGDLRCNVEQAEQVFAALSIRNIPTRLVRYPQSTSHGLSRGGPPDLRVHRLEQILKWWKKWLG